jgi:hypothetical protein
VCRRIPHGAEGDGDTVDCTPAPDDGDGVGEGEKDGDAGCGGGGEGDDERLGEAVGETALDGDGVCDGDGGAAVPAPVAPGVGELTPEADGTALTDAAGPDGSGSGDTHMTVSRFASSLAGLSVYQAHAVKGPAAVRLPCKERLRLAPVEPRVPTSQSRAESSRPLERVPSRTVP